MAVTSDLTQLSKQPRSAAIGNFDGVHLAHRAVLRATQHPGLRRTAISFDPHPRSFFGMPVPLLSSIERRVELLQDAGADDVLMLPFTAELADLSPAEWIERTLVPLGVRRLVVGSDFRFGRRREGDVETLRAWGLDVDPVSIIRGVSSSRIRSLVQAGSVQAAGSLLGRPVELELHVVDGSVDRAGTTLLELAGDSRSHAVPPDGWYRARIGSTSCLLRLTRDPDHPALVCASVRCAERPAPESRTGLRRIAVLERTANGARIEPVPVGEASRAA